MSLKTEYSIQMVDYMPPYSARISHCSLFLLRRGVGEAAKVFQELDYSNRIGNRRMMPFVDRPVSMPKKDSDIDEMASGDYLAVLPRWNHMLKHAIHTKRSHVFYTRNFAHEGNRHPRTLNCRAGVFAALASAGLLREQDRLNGKSGSDCKKMPLTPVFKTQASQGEQTEDELLTELSALSRNLYRRPDPIGGDSLDMMGLAQLPEQYEPADDYDLGSDWPKPKRRWIPAALRL